MALLAKQAASIVGLNPLTMNAANAGGDTVLVDRPNVYLLVRNADATSKTVTIVDPRTTYGQANPDIPVIITTLNFAVIGPIPIDFADANGLVAINYSAVTSVTVGVFTG
jgi:hypothetical protein